MTKKILLLILLLPVLLVAQHSIKGEFSPARSYEWAILYKVSPTTSIYVQRSTVDDEGRVFFDLDTTITKGIYRIVYGLPQEENNFDLIYNGKENIEFSFHKTDGIEYKESKENQLFNSYMKSMDLVNQTINNYYVRDGKDEKAFKSIFKTLKETQENFESASKGLLANNFIKANKPYIPLEYEDVKTYSNNIRKTYFNQVDFSNNILQSSNFLIERILSYIFGMSVDPNDQEFLKSSVDDIAENMKSSQLELRKTLLQIVWQQLADLGFEEAANHVSDAYLLDIAEKTNDDYLKNVLTVFKNTSIGSKAIDFTWETEVKGKKKEESLSGLDIANNYVVVFWSSTCSHCLEELPKLKDYIKASKEGELKVIAVGLEDEPYRWNNESAYYPDFIHVYGEGKWDNPIGNAYGVSATPTYFILDKDKEIVSKPYDFSELKAYFKGAKPKSTIQKVLDEKIEGDKKGN
ncbi:MAG: TlpA family protein disulfide reductase [Bacteroidia bacterium]|nr:TlpA family protein disulfide reductase [Bacteroidia bacterium]NNK27748.1 TlpA family protein disulfide reductase [Flavobacteriaceae bacterium]